MKNKELINRGMSKRLLLVSLIFVSAILFMVSVEGQQEALFCAEKTTWGASCVMVPENECEEGFDCQRTSCDATTYCSAGTCVNQRTGDCLPSPAATCDIEMGGFFYDQPKEEIDSCQMGCCLLGDEAAFVEKVKCDMLGSDYGVSAPFHPDVGDELTCLAMASPEAKGACVDDQRSCEFVTREECQGSDEEFHEGFLCSAPELGTDCSMTQRTTCVEGKNEVYFVDSCGNLANVYDANKIDDVNYWSYVPGVEGVEVDRGDGKGNKNSPTYGACNYIDGSTCGLGNAEYGNFICRDLDCSASELTGGVKRNHGESWCSAPIDDFENANPGQLSHLLYCYDGEVQYRLCDSFRNKLCSENPEAGEANCVPNRWASCYEQENTRDCLDDDYRDCKILEGGAALAFMRTEYGTEKGLIDSDADEEIEAACVPRYPPGFKFWDPEGTIADVPGEDPQSICEFANVKCFVPFTQDIRWVSTFRPDPSQECVDLCESTTPKSSSECFQECTPVCLENTPEDIRTRTDFDVHINREWAEGYQNICNAMGDCGVINNYHGFEGYNRWIDLFHGERINWGTLPDIGDRRQR